MIKKSLVLILAITVLMVWVSMALAGPVEVIVEGPRDEYPHYLDLKVPAIIENGRTLIPLRSIAEALGFQVEWQASDQRIIMRRDQQRIEMQIGSRIAMANAVPVTMDLAPCLIKNTTMVPLRFVAQNMGYSVAFSKSWHENQADVYITPYTLISDEELAQINKINFDEITCEEPGPGSTSYFQLKKGGVTPAGISLGASIEEILKVYGVPHDPQRSLQYASDWSGKLTYWGTFIPQSDGGTWVDLDLLNGSLVNMTISY